MNSKISGLILLLGLGLAGPVMADPTCDEVNESLLACFQRISGESGPQVANVRAEDAAADPVLATNAVAAAKTATDEELADAKPSADTGGGSTAVTLTDLTPIFDALGLLSSDDSTSDQLVLNLNFLLPVQDVENKNTQLQLVVNTQPVPLDQLVQAFDESIRDARKDALQKDISTFGDQELKFNWSLVSTRFGRDFRTLRGLLSPVYEGAREKSLATAKSNDAKKGMRAFMQTLQDNNVPLADAQGKKINTFAEPLRSQLVAATIEAATARATITQEFAKEMAGADLNRLTDLVDQQPQLLFSISHNFRDEIVGPEETSATVTWEMTRRNLGNFMRGEGADCAKSDDVRKGADVYASCVRALKKYLSQDLADQWRFKLEGSYKRVDAVAYSFPADGVALDLPKTERIEVSIGAGREFSGKPDLGRLDFELSYDSNINNDTTNKDRLTAAITLTKRVGDLDIPFSIVYANRNEFLSEVDHEIGMHVGIKFRQTGK